jgi:hypothetical protein
MHFRAQMRVQFNDLYFPVYLRIRTPNSAVNAYPCYAHIPFPKPLNRSSGRANRHLETSVGAIEKAGSELIIVLGKRGQVRLLLEY